MMPLIELRGVTRSHVGSAETVHALHSVDITIAQGESVAIVGASGSGKSSLLNVLGLLDRPSSGSHAFLGQSGVESLPNNARTHLRNLHIGFVFQQFHLLPQLSAQDNVALPLLYGGASKSAVESPVRLALEKVGLSHRAVHMPHQLSGGERQRVAIARALVREPQLLLADEPTGALDSRNGQHILELMLSLQSNLGVTLVVVTHDMAIAQCLQRQITMQDGRVVHAS